MKMKILRVEMKHVLRLPKTIKSHLHVHSKLRKQLIKRHGQCAITGWKNPLEYQMAHIIPKKIGYDIGYKLTDSESNCMLLANGLHSMFDGFQWTVDIYSLLDLNVESDEYFKASLIIKNPPMPGTSSLSDYVDKLVTIPTKYYSSLYAHYYTYLKFNYSSWDSKMTFQVCVDDPVFKTLQGLSTTSEIKSYLLAVRKDKNEYIVILDNHLDQYQVLWNYWSYNKRSWEHTNNLDPDIVEEYQDHKRDLLDPDWKPGLKS